MSDKLLTVREVASLLQISKSKVYNLVAVRQLGCVRIGASVRFRQADVDAFTESCAQPAQTGGGRE